MRRPLSLPLPRPRLDLLAALSLAVVAALAATAGPAAAQPAGAGAAAQEEQGNPIERLYQQRKYEEAILELERHRALAEPPGMADVESEFWGARAETALQLYDAAKQHFASVARRAPNTETGRQAAIEAAATNLRVIGEPPHDDGEQAMARETAQELEGLIDRFAGDSAAASRALYIAGNAWWIAGDVERAKGSWERLLSQFSDDEYSAKALYRLATLASRDFDMARARELYTRCTTQHSGAAYARRCQKNLERLDLVGQEAAPLVVETWLRGEPVDVDSLRGNVVLLWFFATWCPHCKQTMPEIADLLERFSGLPFRVVGITNNTRGQTTEIAKVFVEQPQWRISYPTAVDLAGATSMSYSAMAVPAAVLVDKTGTIRWADHPTYLQESMIESLLAE